MKRDLFYIGIAIFIVVTLVVFGGLFVISEQKRTTAVEELKAKTAFLKEKAAKAKTVKPEQRRGPVSDPNPSQAVTAEKDSEPEFPQYTVKSFGEYLKELSADPEYQKVYQLIHGAWWNWNPEEEEAVNDSLEKYREIILGIRQLAKSNNIFSDIDYEKGYASDFSHEFKVLNYARILTGDAAYLAESGAIEEAFENYIALMRFASACAKEPIMSSYTQNMMTIGVYLEINQYIPGENISPDALREFLGVASQIDAINSFSNAFAIDGLFGHQLFEDIRNREYDYDFMGLQGIDRFLMPYYGRGLTRPLLNMDEQAYVEYMNQMSDAMLLPIAAAIPIFNQLENERENLSFTRVLSNRYMQNSWRQMPDRHVHEQAVLGLMQLGLGIEHYHEENGVYPEALEEIAPILGGTLPRDPYTGESFVYEVNDEAFTLYSDRGSILNLDRHTIASDTSGNIVWRHSGR